MNEERKIISWLEKKIKNIGACIYRLWMLWANNTSVLRKYLGLYESGDGLDTWVNEISMPISKAVRIYICFDTTVASAKYGPKLNWNALVGFFFKEKGK